MLVSVIDVVSSSPCVDPSPRIKIFIFIINMHRWAHISSKNNDIFPMLPYVNGNSQREPIPSHQICIYKCHSHYICIYLDQNS